MANYSNLKSTINTNIKTNGNEEITGAVLNSVLNSMVTAFADGYLLAGVANPLTNPGNPDNNVFYVAAEPGIYENFDNIELGNYEVALLLWRWGTWQKLATNIPNTYSNRFDNYNAISRAPISFPATNQVTIGDGYIYFRKGNVAQYSLLHTEATYTFTGHQMLCFDYVSNSIQVKSTPGETDLVLFWHDNIGGIRGGLLYGYYLLAEIAKAGASVSDNFNAVSRASVTFPAVNEVTIGDGYIYIRKGNEVFETLLHTEATYTFTGTGFLCYNLVSHTLVQRSTIEDDDIVMLWYDGGVGFRAGLLILEWILAQVGGGGGSDSKDNMTLVSRAPISFPESNQVTIGAGYIYLKKGSSLAQTITVAQENTYTFSVSQMLCYNLTTHVVAQKSAPEENDVILLWYDGGLQRFRAGLLYDEYLRQLADNSGLPPMDYVLPNSARPDDTLQPTIHGATQYYPQNSAGLFRLASRNRLNFWECDVRPCLDGYVLAHNDDMSGYALDANGDPIAANTWLCSQKTVAQLKTLKTGILPNTSTLVDGFEDETILTFEEYIILAKTYNAVPVIELKFGATSAQVSDLFATCEKHGMEQKVIWLCYGGRFNNADYIIALDPDAYIMFAFYPPDELVDMKTNLDTCATYIHGTGHICVSMPWENWDDIVGGVILIDYAHTLELRCASWSASNSTYVAQVKAGISSIETDMYNGLMDNALYYLQKYSSQLLS